LGRSVRLVGIVLVIAGLVGAWVSKGHPAGADNGGGIGLTSNYSLTARGDAMAIEIDDKGAPLVPGGQLVFVSPGTAQSTTDSLGNSQAFASAPYPGDFLANLTGTVNGLLAGQAPPIPPYPFIVASNYPTTPSSNGTVGPYVLQATSGAGTSHSQAKIGALTGDPAASSAAATSNVTENADGSATAEASDEIQLVGISSLLQIGHASAHAQVTVAPDGTVTKSSSLDIGSLAVAGIQVGVTDRGLVAGGSTTPLSAAPIEHLLSAAHVGLSYIPKTETATSVRSAGLAVTYTTNVPGQGPVTMTVTYGEAMASAQSAAQTALSDVNGPAPQPPPDLTAGSGTSSPAAPTIGAGDAGRPAMVAAAPPTLASGHTRPRTAIRPAGHVAGLMPSGKTVYLLLVMSGALALSGSRLLGEVAIRQRIGTRNAD
jgi:hypothetical protein